jgi:hypothetical protein
MSAGKYKVVIADNFHYMDESENVTHGHFDTLEEAIAACKLIVEESLWHHHKPGIRAEDLYGSYTSFGDDPYIVSSEISGVAFSAWDYAKQRAQEICGP